MELKRTNYKTFCVATRHATTCKSLTIRNLRVYRHDQSPQPFEGRKVQQTVVHVLTGVRVAILRQGHLERMSAEFRLREVQVEVKPATWKRFIACSWGRNPAGRLSQYVPLN
jgi:hypothetical protein